MQKKPWFPNNKIISSEKAQKTGVEGVGHNMMLCWFRKIIKSIIVTSKWSKNKSLVQGWKLSDIRKRAYIRRDRCGSSHVYVCVCIDVTCVCMCVCTFLCTRVPVLPMCANECEAGDYACVSKGTGLFSQELQCLNWGGYVYTLTPAFRGPGCLSETISFLCGPLENVRMWIECERPRPFACFCNNTETENNQVRATSLNTLSELPLTLFLLHPQSCPHHPCLPKRWLVYSCHPPNNEQTPRAGCIANDRKQLRTHKRERPAILRRIYIVFWG